MGFFNLIFFWMQWRRPLFSRSSEKFIEQIILKIFLTYFCPLGKENKVINSMKNKNKIITNLKPNRKCDKMKIEEVEWLLDYDYYFFLVFFLLSYIFGRSFSYLWFWYFCSFGSSEVSNSKGISNSRCVLFKIHFYT